MDTITLFAVTPPALRVRPPLPIQVPEHYRAELYKAELEDTRLVLESYAARNPKVAPALLDKSLIETLAVLLDDYVGPAVVADVNAFARQTFPGQDITPDTYRRYVAACLERAADPYRIAADWEVAALSSPPGSWIGLAAFYRRYPMVRYMVDTVTENYQRSLQRCCDRVISDWPDLQTFFFAGTPMVALTRIETTGSDFHKGGGQVLLLTFGDIAAQAYRLVYKPTDVERDFRIVGDTQALTAALGAAAPNNLRVVTDKGVSVANLLNNPGGSLAEMLTQQANGATTVPTYRILPVHPGTSLALTDGVYPIRRSYGYLEYLSSDATDNRFTTPQQRATYYLSFGAQLALCWVFQITDLHQENLIVHGRMPYLIDLEMVYSGVMELPLNTNLDEAYKIFTVPSTRRAVTGFGTNALSYAGGSFPAQSTKNALYDSMGVLTMPSPTDNVNLRAMFNTAVNWILQNVLAYSAWLANAQHVITRILPFGTSELFGQLRALNEVGPPYNGVTFPGEIDLKMQRNGRVDMENWGNNFCNAAVVQGNVVPVSTINLDYVELEPRFAVWLDPQTAVDFRNGDVPAYYQRMNTADALNSIGAPIQVNYGAAVMVTPQANQQPLSNALVTLWGTAVPLLPSSYFTGSALQIQQGYLQTLQLNANGFTIERLTAASNDISHW
ncbi:DUF4135 domain-containing protein [Burkholderia plantarii]|uniref:DUF4135 domain-containing protein n=1 Tax=Burkholderia plantarii TaxID=41899 RepID=UPI0018DD9695|nr:DUF4135 domain-containing protein [Burkholderia plantarii]MBI0327294.1 DUF4135 domain-containing protein [Burkholderia plantarii]